VHRFVLVALIAGCRHGAAPGPAPSCAAAAEHVHALIVPKDQRAIDVRDVVLSHCVRDKWRDAVRSCILRTASLKDPQHCKAKLEVGQRASLDGALLDVEQRAKARHAPSTCDRWKQLVTKLDHCDALPRASRDALIESFEIQRRALDRLEPAAAEEQCKAGIESIHQVANGICGW
jgi:hypothetical protein